MSCASTLLFVLSFFFFFIPTAPTELYTLSYTTLFRSHSYDELVARLRDKGGLGAREEASAASASLARAMVAAPPRPSRSEEHTSELQSPYDLVCRLLLEKKKKKKQKKQKKKKEKIKKH